MSLSGTLYRLARLSRDVNAVTRSVKTGSPKPIVKRVVNKLIGRKIVSRLWWR